MRKTKNTIKINGKTYDAISGNLLGEAETYVHNNSKKNIIQNNKTETIKSISTKTTTVKQKHHAVSRSVSKPITRNPDPSKTLMRKSVRKPAHTANSHDKTHIKATSNLPIKSTEIKAKLPARKINNDRLKRANQVIKSDSIKRFNKPTLHSKTHLTPVAPSTINQPSQKPKSSKPANTTLPHRPQQAPRPTNSSELIQKALHHASSHKQPHPRRSHSLSKPKQLAGMSALILSTGAILAFAVIHSAPSIKMRVASAKAGFSASLPGYNPSGFHMGELKYGAGNVAMNFQSNSDNDRSFSVTQKNSAWNSEALRDMFVIKNDKNYRVEEEGGLTIYLYGDNNATWVNNGVWYKVQGNGTISDQQLINIAKSM